MTLRYRLARWWALRRHAHAVEQTRRAQVAIDAVRSNPDARPILEHLMAMRMEWDAQARIYLERLVSLNAQEAMRRVPKTPPKF